MRTDEVIQKAIDDRPDYVIICYGNKQGQRTVLHSEMPPELMTFFLFMLQMATESKVGQFLVLSAIKKEGQ